MEIPREHLEQDAEPKEKRKSKNVLTYTLVILVVGLLLFSAVQTFQIGRMEKAVLGGAVGAVAGSSGAVASGASSPRAASSVPAMVGGC